MYENRSNKQIKIGILNKFDLEGLSPQERQFAQQQSRLIYAQEMSKISIQLSHKKKVLQNLHTLDEQEQKNLKQQYEKLKKKMNSFQEKRIKKLSQKVKHCKQNDQRWENKLKQIQVKMRQQNLEAIDKAKKYRQQSEQYWKDKERKALQNSRAHFVQTKRRDENQVSKSLGNSSLYNANQYHFNKTKKGKTLNQYSRIKNIKQFEVKSEVQDLDEQIKIHKQRSENLQKEKEALVFQKAIQKMEKISKKREIIGKKSESKPAEPTIPRKVDRSHRALELNNRQNKQKRRSMINKVDQLSLQHSKQSLQKLIKDHLSAKQKLQEQQFLLRGQIMEDNIQRKKKDKILKMIKNRVQEMKIETLKKEGSKNNLIH